MIRTNSNQGRFALSICLLALTLASAACLGSLSSYNFETDALYTAPVSGYDIAIHAAGTVDAGADLSQNSRAQVTITPNTANSTAVTFNVTYNTTGFTVTDWPSGETTLEDVLPLALIQAGIQNPSAAEVEETIDAIKGALSGSKGTLMQGQTQNLIVQDVQFTYP